MSCSDNTACEPGAPSEGAPKKQMPINKVAVIGSGVMGGAIAAHCANAGCDVLLLDIVPRDAGPEMPDRNRLASSAIERMKKARPPAFMHPSIVQRVEPGNLEDHLPRLSEADWIIEAIVERADIKRDLFKKIDAVRRKGSIVSSNTSTIPLKTMIADQSEAFASDFMITHFFNPPRYMPLLEIVTGDDTRIDAAHTIRAFCTTHLGKSVVPCRDSPGFIANRIGTYFVLLAMGEAKRLGLSVEEADAICGKPMGMPKTGVFGLVDLVGLDVIDAVKTSLLGNLPDTDDIHRVAPNSGFLKTLVTSNRLGRKSANGGFYKTVKDVGGKQKYCIDLDSLEHRKLNPQILCSLDLKSSSLNELVEHNSAQGRFAKSILVQFLGYVAGLMPEISDNVADVDKAMRLGYGWTRGPFEMIDALGADWLLQNLELLDLAVSDNLCGRDEASFYVHTNQGLEQRRADGEYSLIGQEQDILSLEQIKRSKKPEFTNGSASLWDLGDGVLNFEITTKQNALGQSVFDAFERAFDLVEESGSRWRAMTVYSDAKTFAAGADLNEFHALTSTQDWSTLRKFAQRGQDVFSRMRDLQFPVVAGVSGAALGGGCELILNSTAAVAHAESYIGLVEASVGIIPAWGGCAEMLERHARFPAAQPTPIQALENAFLAILTCQTSTSAQDAKDMFVLRQTDEIVMHRDHVLKHTKAKALSLTGNMPSRGPSSICLQGEAGRKLLEAKMKAIEQKGQLKLHDVIVGGVLAITLTGGDLLERELGAVDSILRLEVDGAMRLFQTTETQKRIARLINK